MKVKVYGSTGSFPQYSDTFYGGNTTCFVIESGDFSLIVDAGTGIIKFDKELKRKYPNYPAEIGKNMAVILSHFHIDHIIGLAAFVPAWNDSANLNIYAPPYGDRPLKEQIFGLFHPPYWPINLKDVNVNCLPIAKDQPVNVGPMTIKTMPASHADGTVNFHISNGEKSVIYMLDSEMQLLDEAGYEYVVEICKGADLVVFDACYAPDDYQPRRGWGHSTYEEGVKLAQRSGCKRMLFSHFSPEYEAADINRWKQDLSKRFPNDGRFIFAHEGMEILI